MLIPMMLCAAALASPSPEQAVRAFYKALDEGRSDDARALLTDRWDDEEFAERWTVDAARLESAERTGTDEGGRVLVLIDHCVVRGESHTGWRGHVFVKNVEGDWIVDEWDPNQLPYSIGDYCPADSPRTFSLAGGAEDLYPEGDAGYGNLADALAAADRRAEEVQVGEWTFSGEDWRVPAPLERLTASVDGCRVEAEERNAPLRGEVSLALEVDLDGKVRSVDVTAHPVADSRFERCVVREAKRWRGPGFGTFTVSWQLGG